MKYDFTKNMEDAKPIAKAGGDLLSEIAKAGDPDNKDTTGSIIAIIICAALLLQKTNDVVKEYYNNGDGGNDNKFKELISSSLSQLRGYVGVNNYLYEEAYNAYSKIGHRNLNSIIYDYGEQLQKEHPNDTKVKTFWDFLMGIGQKSISESDFDYVIPKIKALDCKIIRSKLDNYGSQIVEQTLIPEYISFADDLFGKLKRELKKLGRIV